MLNRWSAMLPDRRMITGFWEWLAIYLRDVPGHNDGVYTEFFKLDIEQLLDVYHEINHKQLDDARRALLEEQRKASEKK